MRPVAGPQTFGTGWLSVVAVPIGPAMAFAGSGGTSGGIISSVVISQGNSASSSAYQSSLRISGPAGQYLALLRLLLKVSKPVHGPWGSGHLLRTNLLSVLLTSKGVLLAGAVTPAVLYADAAKVK